MKLIFTLLILIVSLQIGAAQEMNRSDSLQLQDGVWVMGRVYRYHKSGNILLENSRGYIQSYKAKDIRQVIIHLPEKERKGEIESEERPLKERCEKTYAFREHGFYSITYAGTINGIGYNNNGEVQLGLSLQQVAGFQWNRMLGAGIGIGLENFSVGNANGPLVLPVYAEARGYFLKKNTTPYYALNVGYGFSFKDEDQRILKAQGGWLLHPAIGFRMGARDGVNFLFDVGYKFQHLTLTRDFTQGSRDYQVQNLLYKRFSVRLGLIF